MTKTEFRALADKVNMAYRVATDIFIEGYDDMSMDAILDIVNNWESVITETQSKRDMLIEVAEGIKDNIKMIEDGGDELREQLKKNGKVIEDKLIEELKYTKGIIARMDLILNS